MVFNFFKSFSKVKSYLGVDIGTTTIKAVEVKKTGAAPELLNYGFLESYGHLERLNNAIQTSTLKMLDKETAELLKLLLKNMEVKSKDAVASLPAFSSFITLLELPMMPDKDTAQAMQFQAKQYIPLPISEVTVDWLRVGEREDAKGNLNQQVLLVSVPNELIQKYRNIFSAVGLNLVALEVEGLSTARALSAESGKTAIVVDIGSRSTALSIIRDGFLKFSGQTDFAGGSLTQTIAAGLNIRARRAEDLKKLRGLKGSGGEYELSTLMFPILDVIISEVKRIKSNYEKWYNDKIDQVILAGGGANLLGTVEYFQDQLGLPVAKAKPFSNLKYPYEMEQLINDLGPEFTVAIGLALKNFQS